jgi:hypothetical protein
LEFGTQAFKHIIPSTREPPTRDDNKICSNDFNALIRKPIISKHFDL